MPKASHQGHHRRGALDAGSPAPSAVGAGGPDTIDDSVLAFILLVVLGGGIGLLAVSLAESPKPATDGGPDHRAPDHDGEPKPDAAEPVDESEPEPEVTPEPEPNPEPDPVETTDVLVPVGSGTNLTGSEPRTTPAPRRRPDPRTVPRAYTAIEGRFEEVATPPWWRRLLSLVALVVIAVLIGVGLAAMAAGVIGAVAELIDAAVG